MSHKTHIELEKELEEAKKVVKIGGTYSHFKHPQNLYKLIALGIQEATDKICVIYQAEYNKKLIFVRDLESWLEAPILNGTKVDRFKLVNK